MKLSQDQEAAYKAIMDFLTGRSGESAFVLSGYAGTGKSTLIRKVLNRTGKSLGHIQLAPTHRAARVLETITNEPAHTIHSGLALGLKADHNGRQVTYRHDRPAPADDADLVIIDEAGMIDRALWEHIRPLLAERLVIFVGDPGQLPPTSGQECPLFSPKFLKLHNIGHASLDQVHRQAEGGILNLATRIRNKEFREYLAPDKNLELPRSGEYAVWSKKDLLAEGMEPLRGVGARILTYTNAAEQQWNSEMRAMEHGGSPPPFIEGETLVLKSRLRRRNGGKWPETLLQNSEEVRVAGYRTRAHTPANGLTLSVYEVMVIRHTGQEVLAHAPTPKGEVKLSDWRARLANKAKHLKSRGDKSAAAFVWETILSVEESLLRFTYGHALTTHKAQGGGFETVALDLQDMQTMLKVNGPIDYRRILYTAATRAEERLVLLV